MTTWWKVEVVIVVSSVVVGISGRWCAIGWSRSPCGKRCIVRRIFVQQRVPSSKRSPIDDVFLLNLIDGVKGYLRSVVFGFLCMVVSVTSEKVIVEVWVIGERDSHQSL